MANLLKRKDKKKFLKVATEKDTVLKGSTIRLTAMEIMETRIQSDNILENLKENKS